MALGREPQLRMPVTAGDPASGYYNDLRATCREFGSPPEALAWIELLLRRRERLAPVTLLQLGLGAWQLRDEDARWLYIVGRIADWIAIDMDGFGRLAYHFAMPHTYAIEPPWFSAMAQGQAASFLVRASLSLERPELMDDALRAITSLLDHDSNLRVESDDGPVLQEYPSDPPAHVLNGWIFALWGLFDVAHAPASIAESTLRSLPTRSAALQAFQDGATCLAHMLPQYAMGNDWSRYDLFPHPIVHAASPFYHRLHIEQLESMQDLAPNPVFERTALQWRDALDRRRTRTLAVIRKTAFRLLRPRRKVA